MVIDLIGVACDKKTTEKGLLEGDAYGKFSVLLDQMMPQVCASLVVSGPGRIAVSSRLWVTHTGPCVFGVVVCQGIIDHVNVDVLERLAKLKSMT